MKEKTGKSNRHKPDSKESPGKTRDGEISLGSGKRIAGNLFQYPKKVGKHGIDDERNLNPEE
jgi:hypothetical protein